MNWHQEIVLWLNFLVGHTLSASVEDVVRQMDAARGFCATRDRDGKRRARLADTVDPIALYDHVAQRPIVRLLAIIEFKG